MSAPAPAPDRVLAVVDQCVLVTAVVVTIGNVIQRPLGSEAWVWILRAFVALTVVLALLGRAGRARWRGRAYPALLLAGAIGALWANGPMLGVGVSLALATLLAGVLLSRAGLAWVVGIAIGATALRVGLAAGHAAGPGDLRGVTFSEPERWIRAGVSTGLLLWVASRILGAVLVSLEESYAHARDALQIATAARAQVARSRTQLEQVEQVELVGRLAGGVAHDVNNALTAILAASDVLTDEVRSVDHQRWLAELEGASQHAAELVRDLLWIGRRLPPTTGATDLADTVKACRARLVRMARAIAIEVTLESGELRVALAPERLEQLLFWLVLRAHRSGITELALAGRRDGAEIEIEIHGIAGGGAPSASLDVAPRAMRAQLSSAAATEVVEQAGGSLTIGERGGLLRVVVRLPAASEERRVAPPLPARTRTALVVDDEPAVLGRLTKLVERRGYHVLPASSLAEAWPLLATNPALLVTDLQLGDGRGEELAIASFEGAPARPIVVCSGFGADDALRERLRGADVTFLAKPFTRAELEVAIPALDADGARPLEAS